MATLDLIQQKIKMWREKLAELKKRYAEIVTLRGEAATMGDLRENAAFQDADEQSAVLSKRIAEVENILSKLASDESGPKGGKGRV